MHGRPVDVPLDSTALKLALRMIDFVVYVVGTTDTDMCTARHASTIVAT